MTLRSPGWVGCEYLPPASRVHLEQGGLHLERPGPPLGASLEDEAVARFLQAPPQGAPLGPRAVLAVGVLADRLRGADHASAADLAGWRRAGLAYAAVVSIPSGIASRQFAELLVRLALGPLAILRVDELRPPNAPGPWDTVIWIAALILGTVCLGFALVAIRKVTRAAH